MSQTTVSVHILGKEYKIACPADEKQQLLDAANHLDEQMREIREQGKVVGMERIAVMTALNLSYELLESQKQNQHQGVDTEAYVKRSNDKLDNALHRLRQLEI